VCIESQSPSQEVALRVVISLCLALFLAFPAGAQETSRATVDSAAPTTVALYRSPHRARLYGIIPGGGYVYSGEYLKGFVTYEETVGGIGAGILVFMVDKCTFSFLSYETCKPGPEWPHQLAGVALAGIGLWTWISSARDAPHAAERANARHKARTLTVTPIIEPLSGPRNRSQVGVSVLW
jgi:hypothetical protein